MSTLHSVGIPRVAVIGAGAFGRNHLRVYRSLQQEGLVHLAACVDPDPSARTRVAAEYGIPVFESLDAFFAADLGVTAASVCTPTVHHADTALALLHAVVDVLIEKPIAATLSEADAIVSTAQVHGRIAQVGHLERFNPAVVAAMPLLNRPMFFEAHRLSVFTPRSLDVDVVLDLMIHDLDVVLTMAQSPVREVRAVGLPVLSQKTDIANVRVEFESGAVANFTASRISTERVRKLRFFQPHQYLSLDFARQDVLMIDVTAAASLTPAQMEALFTPPGTAAPDESHTAEEVETHLQGLRSGAEGAPPLSPLLPHPSAGLSLRKVSTEPGEPLRAEILSFLHAVRTRTVPAVTAVQGRSALALALEINSAIAGHARLAGLQHASPLPERHSPDVRQEAE